MHAFGFKKRGWPVVLTALCLESISTIAAKTQRVFFEQEYAEKQAPLIVTVIKDAYKWMGDDTTAQEDDGQRIILTHPHYKAL